MYHICIYSDKYIYLYTCTSTYIYIDTFFGKGVQEPLRPLQLARVDARIDPNFHEALTIEVIERGSAVHCVSAYEGDTRAGLEIVCNSHGSKCLLYSYEYKAYEQNIIWFGHGF